MTCSTKICECPDGLPTGRRASAQAISCCKCHHDTQQVHCPSSKHTPSKLDFTKHYNHDGTTAVAIANSNSKSPIICSTCYTNEPRYDDRDHNHNDRGRSNNRRTKKAQKRFWKWLWRALAFLVIVGALCILFYVAIEYARQLGYLEGTRDTKSVDITDFVPDRVELKELGPCPSNVVGKCEDTYSVEAAIQWARYYLELGDANSALSDFEAALRNYRNAIDLGSGVGAQSANLAAKRIQYLSMTCEYTQESLARISRNYEANILGESIKMKHKQRALTALGHFNDTVNGKHSATTRAAIKDFQGSLWFDQKGALSAEQTVFLICGAAQIAKDISSQNILGIMYAGGLGVTQNTDFALDWLETAAQRGDADANWNLAMLYGTKTVLSSVQVCDAVENTERADSYLHEAAHLGHPLAGRLFNKYANISAEARWAKFEIELTNNNVSKPEFINRVGRGCNPN